MGRDKRNETASEHFTKLVRRTLETPAWRALSLSAQALYPWLKLQWRGPKANNNGALSLSSRQAAERMGCTPHTAAAAFRDLQAKGFVVVTAAAALGVTGKGKSATFEVTELPLPGWPGDHGRRLYLTWAEGQDYPVATAPKGSRGPGKKTEPRVENRHTPVSNIATFQPRGAGK
jgi:hypothetical protein